MTGSANNTEADIIAGVEQAWNESSPIAIIGGDSKSFLGYPVSASPLPVQSHSGIIAYEPTELFITAKAGTPLQELESSLDPHQQMLAFEPPCYSKHSTVGGMVASGLSGCRRPYAGSVRDYVLGVRCINGRGEVMNFGGQVIKNVAGYDVSRLLTGSYGTLAVILEVTLRVAPKPQYETSLSIPMNFTCALEKLQQWTVQSLPISAAVHDREKLLVRLSGSEQTVNTACQKINTVDAEEIDTMYWRDLNNHRHEFFTSPDKPVWRLSLPANTAALDLAGEWLIDWGGAQRWFKSDEDATTIRTMVANHGGHATLFYTRDNTVERFHALSSGLENIHRNIKQAFDPKGILNPGRMYTDL